MIKKSISDQDLTGNDKILLPNRPFNDGTQNIYHVHD